MLPEIDILALGMSEALTKLGEWVDVDLLRPEGAPQARFFPTVERNFNDWRPGLAGADQCKVLLCWSACSAPGLIDGTSAGVCMQVALHARHTTWHMALGDHAGMSSTAKWAQGVKWLSTRPTMHAFDQRASKCFQQGLAGLCALRHTHSHQTAHQILHAANLNMQ